MSIHKRIRERREELGLSMQALADLVGVSAWQTVQQWERDGGTAPKRERLAAVATALKMKPEELMLGTSPTDTPMSAHVGQLTDSLGISMEALKIAKAYDRLKSPEQRSAVLSQLVAFGALK